MAAPDRSIYLHIGPAKTGTTYLQDVLWRNRHRLAKAGVGFPGRGPVEHFWAATDLRQIHFGGHDNPATHGAWPALAEKALAAAKPKAILTHEAFCPANEEQIDQVGQALAGAELHLIFGARDLARQLPAVWQESLKNRRAKPYGKYLKNALRPQDPTEPPKGLWRAQDTIRSLHRWSRIVPPERIHVVTLPQRGAPRDTLWQRFAVALGVDPAGFDLDVGRANASLSRESSELLRRLNLRLPDTLAWPEYERLVKSRFNHVADDDPGTTPLRMPLKHRAALLKRAAETQAALIAGGYHIIGDLDDLIPADSAFAAVAKPAPAMVTDAAVAMLATVLTESRGRQLIVPKDRARTLMHQITKRRSGGHR